MKCLLMLCSAELLLLMFPVLMTATTCGGTVCDFPPAPLYYGILGKAAFLHVPIPSNTQRFCLEKEKKVILEDEAEAGSVRNIHRNGVELFSSGAVKISRCVKNHSGEYRWKTFGSDGEPQCDVTFMLEIHDHYLCSPGLHSFSQPSAEDQSSASLLTPDCSSASATQPEQICVNRKVFLLLCGALAAFLTLITTLFCLIMMLKRTSPCSQASPDLIPGEDVLYAEVDICRTGKRNGKEGETPECVTAIYSEVAQEVNPETGNQTFTTYGLN